MTYTERLLKAMEIKGLGQSDLAAKIGVKPQAIQHLCNPKKNVQGSSYTASLARACGVNALWLEREEGEMLEGRPAALAKKLSHPHIEFAEMASQLSGEHRRIWRENWSALAASDQRTNKTHAKTTNTANRGIPCLDLSTLTEDDRAIVEAAINMVQEEIEKAGKKVSLLSQINLARIVAEKLKAGIAIVVADELRKFSRTPAVNKRK